jgi:two-component system phosphate regulon sensor histidine kinase PhoR
MAKKIIAGLITLLGLSILGIVAVQVVWMKNAVMVRNELFDRSVTEALHQSVARLSTIHDVMIISELAAPDSISRITGHFTTLPPPPRVAMKRKKNNPGIQEEIAVEIQADSIGYKIRRSGDFRETGLPEWNDTLLRGNKKIVILRNDSLRKLTRVITEGKVILDSFKLAFESEEAIRKGLDQRIHVRANHLRNLAERARSEIIMLDNPKIDREKLEQILTEELEARKIPIAFQYGVFKDSTLLVSTEKPDTLALLSATFTTNLYPDNIFRRNLRLSLIFPSRDRFIFQSIGWLLGASFLFSLFILVAFAASVFLLLRQKKISEMKADFINNMTHEFKTPIATISVASDSILNEKVIGDREKVQYFTGMIKKENQRMNRQVEDILTIARLEKKEFGFRWEEVDIHEVITDVTDVIRIQIEQREGKMLSVFEATKSILKADRQHLSNVVFNLIDNANKYSPESPDIMIRTTNRNQSLVLTVTDKGSGMTRQVQKRIFERFYRQPSGNIHNVKGFGLGLNYVRAVVEAHQGTIAVHSEPGRGSSFEISFPCKNGNGS